MGITKNVKMTGAIAASLLVATMAFNNCTQMRVPASTGSAAGSLTTGSTKEEEAVVKITTKASGQIDNLMELDAALKDKENQATGARRNDLITHRKDVADAIDSLTKMRDKILHMLNVQKVPIGSADVLLSVDQLVLAVMEGKLIETRISLLEKIGQVEQDAIDRDKKAQAQIDQLQRDLNIAVADLNAFKLQVAAKFKSIDDQIGVLNKRMDTLNKMIEDYKTASETADALFAIALTELRNATESQINELTLKNAELKEAIAAQRTLWEDLFKDQQGVASIAGRLCKLKDDGSKADDETRLSCNGSEANIYSATATCCINVKDVDCSIMFPNETQLPARNQCSMMVATLRNHDEQLAAIREVDAKQTTLIDGLLKDVKNLSEQTAILAEGQKTLQSQLNIVVAKVAAIDKDVAILKLKANRSEAVASLLERADFNRGWIAERVGHLKYCYAMRDQALNQFDYEAARQYHWYCNDKQAQLNEASKLNSLASGFAQGLLTLNIDSECSGVVPTLNKAASSLTNEELLNPVNFQEVMNVCPTGGRIVAQAQLVNIVALQSAIGPDFRTVAYMRKKGDFAQIAYFGSTLDQASAQKKAEFEITEPTHALVRNTLYGKVERAYKKRWVENRLRVNLGQGLVFAENPASMTQAISNFWVMYTNKEIKDNASLAPIAALDFEGECSDCGFVVEGRNNVDVVVSKGAGKERFSYPKEIESLCPIEDDHVVLKSAGTDKHYLYRLSYNGMQEVFSNYQPWGGHVVLANGEAAITNGEFAYCGRSADHEIFRSNIGQDSLIKLKSRAMLRVTQPYGQRYAGRAHCMKSTVVCVMREGEWTAPASPASAKLDFISYLNGLDSTALNNKCKLHNSYPTPVPANVVIEESVSDINKNRMSYYPALVDQATINWRNGIITENNTQLSSNYWTLRDNEVTYAALGVKVSKAAPFFASPQSHTDRFVRRPAKITQDLKIQVCKPVNAP